MVNIGAGLVEVERKPDGVSRERCPIDLQSLGWTEQGSKLYANEDGSYWAEATHIGGLIFHVRHGGYLDEKEARMEVERLSEFLDMVAAYHPAARAVFVVDGSEFSGMSMSARRIMKDVQAQHPAFGGSVIYNASMAIRVFASAINLLGHPYRLATAESRLEADRVAVAWTIEDGGPWLPGDELPVGDRADSGVELTPERLGLTAEDLRFESSDGAVSITMRHLEGAIYEQTNNRRRRRGGDDEWLMMDRVLKAVRQHAPTSGLYILHHIKGLTTMSLAARRAHVANLRRMPYVRAVAIVGADMHFGRPLAWAFSQVQDMDIRFFENAEDALGWLRTEQASAAQSGAKQASPPSRISKTNVDKLVERLSRVAWDPECRPSPLSLPENDPLQPLVAAIDLLGEDIGELLEERDQQTKRQERRETLMRLSLADLAHDIRSPLTSLTLGFDALSAGRDFQTIGPVLRAEIDHLDLLFHNLSSLLRFGATSARVRVEEVPVSALCERVHLRFQVLARDKGIAFVFEGPKEGVNVEVDSMGIEQALSNLVHNAIKYAKTRVVVGLEEREKEVVIRIEDDGIGMKGLDVPTLTGRYIRGARETDAKRDGSGLGLAIASTIVGEHGGQLTLENLESGGARVQVTLPTQAP